MIELSAIEEARSSSAAPPWKNVYPSHPESKYLLHK